MDEVVKVVSEMYPSIVGKYLHSVSHVSQYLMPWISRNFYNQLCDQHQPEVSKYFLDTLDTALIHPPWSPMVTLVTQWRIIQSMKTRTLQLARQENRKFIFTTNSSWSCEVHHLILSAINPRETRECAVPRIIAIISYILWMSGGCGGGGSWLVAANSQFSPNMGVLKQECSDGSWVSKFIFLHLSDLFL